MSYASSITKNGVGQNKGVPLSLHDPKESIRFFNDKCSVLVANNSYLRKKVYRFLYEEYSKMGYAPKRRDRLWFSLYDSLPATMTLIAENHQKKMAGALTLVFDSPLGLPAERLYPDEIGNLRQTRPRICEIISFATSRDVRGSIRYLAGLFYCVYLLARKKDRASDLVITVNNRQEDFYCKNLLFDKLGSLKSYDKVNGAPAVLLHLDWELIDRKKDSQRIFPLSMFDYTETEERELILRLNDMMSPMTHDEYIELKKGLV